MNENLDLTKILDGCPVGTEFYHTVYGKVWFIGIDFYSDYPIRLSTESGCIADISVTEKGTFGRRYNDECLFFPSKDQRDWSKFERFWDKPKVEKFDPKTLQPFDKVLVRDSPLSKWRPDFFGFLVQHENYIICSGSFWYQCIPYNEETKHLLGTTDNCPEYYKWW